MKRILAILLVLCMLLCGCGGDEEETTEATQSEVTEESSKVEEKEEESKVEESSVVEEEKEVYRHPLNGEVLEEPWKGVAAASTINNAPDALPQYGISEADIFYEIEV